MSRFRNTTTNVVVSVDDSKDDRFSAGWESLGAEQESAPSQYDAFKVDDLKAEIARRNEGRDEAALLPTEGKKADLVTALEADDNK